MATASDEYLDMKVTNQDAAKLASFMVNWDQMRPYLGLNYAQQIEIENAGNFAKQKMVCVEKWRQKAGDKATYRAFIEAAREAELIALAHEVEAMLRDQEKCRLTL